MGRIITFYSFKGGVGRSMSLANVAVLLGTWGYSVLAIDFDLEAPGLESFFTRSIDGEAAREAPGVIDILSEAASSGQLPPPAEWRSYLLDIRTPRARGKLSLLTAGRRSPDYFKRVQTLDFEEFYSTRNGGILVERLRDDLKSSFDFILIDSRTGFTEIGRVCTVQLPDLIVLLFTATRQALDGGIEMVGRAARARQGLPFERPSVPVLPIPSRIDMSAEFRLTQRWLDTFSQSLTPIFADWLPRLVNPRTFLEQLKLPHIPFFSYGETLPVLEQGTVDPAGLGYAYETMAGLLARNLQEVESLVSDRASYIRLASNAAPEITKERDPRNIFISYSHEDGIWLDQLRKYLAPITRSRDLLLWDDTQIQPDDVWRRQISRAISDAALAIVMVTPDYLASSWVQDYEWQLLQAASRERGLRVVCLAVRPSSFDETYLAGFRFLNDPSRPLADIPEPERDRAWVDIAKKVAEMAGQPY